MKWCDDEGNVYFAERASNGRWVCIRLNAGGNRKCVKQVGAFTNPFRCKSAIADYAKHKGWKEVPQ